MDEIARLAALQELDLLDTPPEREFDDLVRLAAAICVTPISQFTLIDRDRQWFKASFGSADKENPRSVSFCAHAIEQQGLYLIEDAASDPRFRHNPLVTGDPGIRFYAGLTLHAPSGAPIGTLCVVDTIARSLTQDQREALAILRDQVQAHIDLRARSKALETALAENQRLCSALKTSNDIFANFMNNGPFASYIKDEDGAMIFYNRFLARRFGVDQQQWLGRRDHEIWPEPTASEFRRNDLDVLRKQQCIELDETSPGQDGTTTHWKTFKFPCQKEDGRMLLAGISIDITREIRREEELAETLRQSSVLTQKLEASEHFLQHYLDRVPNLCYIKDENGVHLFYNKEFANFFGIDQNEWIGRADLEVLPRDFVEMLHRQDRRVLETGEIGEVLGEITDGRGIPHTFRILKFAYKDFSGRTLLGGVGVDITNQLNRERHLAEANAELQHLAATDMLTGLANRRVFEGRAAIEFAVARRKQRSLSLIVMDIDDFKRRNDLLGHAAGDDALKLLAGILKSCTRQEDLVARIGGEEFAFLLAETNSPGAVAFAERIRDALRAIQLEPLALTVSIGIATLDDATPTWERLLCRADDAMYEAKRTGKNKVVVYDHLLANLLASARQPADKPFPEPNTKPSPAN
jgi:diguanylate cyclase (GGDEF)-like protein/PAS domain S-box-containing protein